jgi:hypothetical protein
VYKELNSTATLIQTRTTEAPQRTDVLHRTGHTQEEHQFLRKGRERVGFPARQSGSNPSRSRSVDEDASAALDGGHGSDDLYRLDL